MMDLTDAGTLHRSLRPSLADQLTRQATEMGELAARWLEQGDLKAAATMHLIAARLACSAAKARARASVA
jgi:hypothetical protein